MRTDKTAKQAQGDGGQAKHPANPGPIRRWRREWAGLGLDVRLGIYINVLMFLAAAAAAIFAFTQLTLTRETFVNGQRAWLTVDEESITFMPQRITANTPTNIRFAFKNSGLVPARVIRLSTRAAYGGATTTPPPDPFAGDDPARDALGPGIVSRGIVGPDMLMHVSYTIRPPTPEQINALQQRKLSIFIHTRVIYDDGFGQTRETAICFMYMATPAELIEPDGFLFCSGQSWAT